MPVPSIHSYLLDINNSFLKDLNEKIVFRFELKMFHNFLEYINEIKFWIFENNRQLHEVGGYKVY